MHIAHQALRLSFGFPIFSRDQPRRDDPQRGTAHLATRGRPATVVREVVGHHGRNHPMEPASGNLWERFFQEIVFFHLNFEPLESETFESVVSWQKEAGLDVHTVVDKEGQSWCLVVLSAGLVPLTRSS